MNTKTKKFVESLEKLLPHIKLLNKSILMSESALFKCTKHNTKYEAVPSELLRQKFGGCKQCLSEYLSESSEHRLGQRWASNTISHEEFSKRVKARFHGNIVLSSTYETSTKDIECLCKSCDHSWVTKPSNLMASVVGCPKCGRELANSKCRKSEASFKRELSDITNGNIILLESYKGDSTIHKFKCLNCGSILKKRPNTYLYMHTRKSSHCQYCAPSYVQSDIAVEWLKAISKKHGVYIQHAKNEGEYIVEYRFEKKNKTLKLDGYCDETDTAYEFYGDYFHGNPLIYGLSEAKVFGRTTHKALYLKTCERQAILLSLGIRVVYVWESHFKKGHLISGILRP